MPSIYMSLNAGSGEIMWLNSGVIPNSTSGGISNIGSFFDPNFYIATSGPTNAAADGDAVGIIEIKLQIEGRG